MIESPLITEMREGIEKLAEIEKVYEECFLEHYDTVVDIAQTVVERTVQVVQRPNKDTANALRKLIEVGPALRPEDLMAEVGHTAVLLATKDDVIKALDKNWKKKELVQEFIDKEVTLRRPTEYKIDGSYENEPWLLREAFYSCKLSLGERKGCLSEDVSIKGRVEDVSLENGGSIGLKDGTISFEKVAVTTNFQFAVIDKLFGHTDRRQTPGVYSDLMPTVAIKLF